jgi:integrase
LVLSNTWETAIGDFVTSQRAVHAPETTLYTRRQHLQHLARRIEADPWELTTDQLAEYMAAQDWARETRRGRRATFEAFYSWAVTTGRAPANPVAGIAKIKPSEPRPNPVPDDVYLAALAMADEDERLWVDLAAEHGLRRAEIARIHSRDIVPTLLGHDLTVHGKGGKIRTVPLTRPMARVLLERGAGFLFRGEDHGHVSPRWLGTRVGRLLAGGWTIHKLRHRAATRFWVVSGGDPYAVADLMGWASLNMVRTYVKQPDDRLRRIVEGASRAGAPIAA